MISLKMATESLTSTKGSARKRATRTDSEFNIRPANQFAYDAIDSLQWGYGDGLREWVEPQT